MLTLVEGFVISGAVLAGLDWRVVAILCAAFALPLLTLAAVATHALRNRSRRELNSAVFCQTAARVLRSGATLREAVIEAATAVGAMDPARALEEFRPWAEVMPHLMRAFPDIGQELGVVIESVAVSGANSVELFEELAAIALSHAEAGEEIRIATASARASSKVLIGLPVAYLGYLLQSGNLGSMLGHEGSGLMGSVGLALLLAGIGVSGAIVRWAR